MNDLKSKQPKTKLLYVTPELLATPDFRFLANQLHEKGFLSRLVVDEAHCISEWGHDFRKDYRKLDYWKTAMKLPMMALTATATTKVVQDIKKELSLEHCKVNLYVQICIMKCASNHLTMIPFLTLFSF